MTASKALVVTTINSPTQAVLALQAGANKASIAFHIVGDTKSPADFQLPGAEYYDIQRQLAMDSFFARACPTKHYARKNIGYLAALRAGADVIIETDDDNAPLANFWDDRSREVTAPMVTAKGWNNVYRYFTDAQIWPRGLPLDRILDPTSKLPSDPSTADCPVQQGLADDNPDVDAIYRLVLPLPLKFEPDRTVILDKGVWCPFNSQNTTFWRDAFPLLYLPYHCSFRMTDIWRSFVAQRIMWENGWRLMFHSATVFQDRNEHDLMIDFRDEVPGYLNNERIRRVLEDLDLRTGIQALPDNLTRCYGALVELGVIGKAEQPLLNAWLADLTR